MAPEELVHSSVRQITYQLGIAGRSLHDLESRVSGEVYETAHAVNEAVSALHALLSVVFSLDPEVSSAALEGLSRVSSALGADDGG